VEKATPQKGGDSAMRKHITWAMALGLMLAATAASAQTRQTPPQPSPAEKLHIGPRVREGIRSGQLTRPEVQRLRQRFGRIRDHARELRGQASRLTPENRAKVLREWRQASRALYMLRHNKIRRDR
jgi:hypothetical protein